MMFLCHKFHQNYKLPLLTSGRLDLNNICGQFECGMLLVNTAVKTKWPELTITSQLERLMGFPWWNSRCSYRFSLIR